MLVGDTTMKNKGFYGKIGQIGPRPPRLKFLDYTQLHTHTHTHKTHTVGQLWTGDKLVAEGATYTTHSKHKGRTSISSAGFETALPATADLRLRPRGYPRRPRKIAWC